MLYTCRRRSFSRNPKCTNFEDEKPRPFLGNLTSHTSLKHPVASERDNGACQNLITEPKDHGFTAASVKLMEEYLAEGKLNPCIERTQTAFLKFFTSWILEDDLAFTTGESPGLGRMLKFLGCRFTLPSDTTVRNTLSHLFTSMHCTVVEELSVSKLLNNLLLI